MIVEAGFLEIGSAYFTLAEDGRDYYHPFVILSKPKLLYRDSDNGIGYYDCVHSHMLDLYHTVTDQHTFKLAPFDEYREDIVLAFLAAGHKC